MGGLTRRMGKVATEGNAMKRVLDNLPRLMKDSEFAKAYADAEEEFTLAREIIKTRAAAGLSQQERTW